MEGWVRPESQDFHQFLAASEATRLEKNHFKTLIKSAACVASPGNTAFRFNILWGPRLQRTAL